MFPKLQAWLFPPHTLLYVFPLSYYHASHTSLNRLSFFCFYFTLF